MQKEKLKCHGGISYSQQLLFLELGEQNEGVKIIKT